ncbi:MAG TPA: alpha/beta hydrolase [Woeseiaceae bacterium]|nr:alpha/beta hydrolase [Woeseiaceae bacterium]
MLEITTPDGHIIHGTHWPAAESRGIVQIFHGLGEHHARYARFAALANAENLAVVAHDHRGHGDNTGHRGHFADANGWQKLIDDGLLVNEWVRERHPGLPLVLLGHSMGSYIAQYFTMQHFMRVSALLLSASTWPNRSALFAGRLLALLVSKRIGLRGKSPLLDKLGFGDFNKRFEPARTPLDWLSRDDHEVDRYIDDPLCGGPYTCGLWLDLLGGLRAIASDDVLLRIPANMPLLLTGGSDDPVGGDRGITQLAMHYAQTGHSGLAVKIYEGGRHEMFNETNRDEFTADVIAWINQRLTAREQRL